MTKKQVKNKGKVSTNRSDEDPQGPGSTLSYLIVRFDPFWPEVVRLAMIFRLVGLRLALSGTAGPIVVA